MTTCSECGAIKREVNHWYFLWLERGGARLCITPWEEDTELQFEPHISKLCGMACAIKAASRWMTRG